MWSRLIELISLGHKGKIRHILSKGIRKHVTASQIVTIEMGKPHPIFYFMKQLGNAMAAIGTGHLPDSIDLLCPLKIVELIF